MTDTSIQRPCVTLKLATSLDGRIATVAGHSKWITGDIARTRVHQMRAAHDCVLTGIGTVLADDPELTARLQPPASHQPLRAVVDSHARTPNSAKLLQTLSQGPVCLFHDHRHHGACAGLDRIQISRTLDGSGLDLTEILSILQSRFHVKTVMVEAGARLAGSFLRAKLVDKIVWFRAPIILGGDAMSVFSALGVTDLSQAISLTCTDISKVGDDVIETYALQQQD